jgi:multiple sugar transport system substrate-binding protein
MDSPFTRRQVLRGAFAAAASATFLSACGSGGGSATTGGTSAAKQSFSFSAWPGNNAERFYEASVAAFERSNPNVTVKTDFKLPHEQYATVIQSRLSANQLPDLFINDGNAVPGLTARDVLAPMSPMIEAAKIDLAQFPSAFIDGFCSKDGVVYALPYSLSPNLFIYRTDVFESAGVRPPETWDELIALAHTLRDKAGMRYPFAFDPAANYWASDWIFQTGGDVMNADRSEYTFDSPEVTKAIEFVHGLLYREAIVDPALPKLTDGVMRMWGRGDIACFQGGGFQLSTLDTQYPQYRGRWAVAPLPGDAIQANIFDGAPLLIARTSKARQAAFDLTASMITPAAGLEMMKVTGGMTAGNLGTYDLPEYETAFPHLTAVKGAIANGRVFPATPTFAEAYYQVFASSYQKLMADAGADIPAALAAVNKRANDVLKRG